MLRNLLSVFLVLVLTTGVFAQVVPLKTLLSRTLRHAPSLHTDSAAVTIANSREQAFYNVGLPNLRLNYQSNLGTNNNLPGGYFSFGIVPGNSRVRQAENTSTVLSTLGIVAFDWELYNFGGFGAAKHVAQADVQTEQARYEQSKYEIQAKAIYYYFNLLMLRDLEKFQWRNIKRNQEIYRSIHSLAKSGIIAGVDTSTAKAELSRARQRYYELVGQYKKTQLHLANMSGLEADRIEPDTTYVSRMLAIPKPATVRQADTALHPLLRYYSARLLASNLQETFIRKSYHPKLSLQAALWGRGASVDASDNFNALHNGFDLSRSNYLVGLGVSYNVSDLWRKHLQLGVQRAASRQAQARLSERRSMLDLDLKQSVLELEVARQRLEEIPEQLGAAQAAYRQKFSLYKNGLSNLVDLNAALFALYRAETDLVNARYAFCEAIFKRAVIENRVDEILNLLN
ncbi:TolC family protein [Dawidia soli]|uniref:TolC family protein n=1 Tax=Dawidia soli TaxID=2782352 RepID=A0AAP2GHX0_9BACT|nr:TolC family protein [Dawidia soli]MBT1686438.1 TolC family protein [Dawidia soli]